MSRSYKNVRPKIHFVYTVKDLMVLYDVERNTVSNWVKEGLKTSDGFVPYVFSGREVKRFHDARRITTKAPMRLGEFNCFKCKRRVLPKPKSLTCYIPGVARFGLRGECSNCDGVVTKIVNESDCDKILKCANTNTSLASLDEGYEAAQAGIGIDRHSKDAIWYVENDRILWDWLQLEGRWNDKTISAKIAAIRTFEAFCNGKAFTKIKKSDVVAFRQYLKLSVEGSDKGKLSVSTVRHLASHLKSFFAWLVEQQGYTALGKTLPEYFDLPKKFHAISLSPTEQPTPTTHELVKMLEGMPIQTITQRRDRAMVATACLAAIRADTTISLKFKHLEISNKTVVQDAKRSRTKNGKSLKIKFFPLPPFVSKVACDWKNELTELGFEEDDALFPDAKDLVGRGYAADPSPVPVMTSKYAVNKAFRTASAVIDKKYSPHSAKHLIGGLGLLVCKTLEEEVAWSENMGHDNPEITRRYYQKVAPERVVELFEQFDISEEGKPSYDELQLMNMYHEHKLVKGTQEFERAERLVANGRASRTPVDLL